MLGLNLVVAIPNDIGSHLGLQYLPILRRQQVGHITIIAGAYGLRNTSPSYSCQGERLKLNKFGSLYFKLEQCSHFQSMRCKSDNDVEVRPILLSTLSNGHVSNQPTLEAKFQQCCILNSPETRLRRTCLARSSSPFLARNIINSK